MKNHLAQSAFFSRKYLVKEDTGEQRRKQSHEGCHEGKDKRQPESLTGSAEVFSDIREDTRLFTTFFKSLRRLEGQTDTGKMLAELLHRPLHWSHARVVDAGTAFLVEASEHHEVLEVPVDDGRLLAVEGFGTHAEPLGVEAVVAGSPENHLCRRSVTTHTAIGTHLFQREPLAVVGQYHRQRRCPTLHRLHLHYLRHLHNLVPAHTD